MCLVAVTVCQLPSCLPRPLSSFLQTNEISSSLPAFNFFHSVMDCVSGCLSFRFFFEILHSAWSSETHFGFSECSPGFLHGAGRTVVFFCVCFVNFWQRHATVLFSLLWAWSLLVFVYRANVCSCKACVCLCVLCFYWKSEYLSYHSLDSCYNKCIGYSPVQIFLQFDFIWRSQRFHGRY
jgi:hypothetical protein